MIMKYIKYIYIQICIIYRIYMISYIYDIYMIYIYDIYMIYIYDIYI